MADRALTVARCPEEPPKRYGEAPRRGRSARFDLGCHTGGVADRSPGRGAVRDNEVVGGFAHFHGE